MSPEPVTPRAAALLARIADVLGVPVSYFTDDPPLSAELGALRAAAGILADPDGRRIVQAFLDVPSQDGRRALADAVVAVASQMALKTALRG